MLVRKVFRVNKVKNRLFLKKVKRKSLLENSYTFLWSENICRVLNDLLIIYLRFKTNLMFRSENKMKWFFFLLIRGNFYRILIAPLLEANFGMCFCTKYFSKIPKSVFLLNLSSGAPISDNLQSPFYCIEK